MEECKDKVLGSLKVLHEEIDKELKAYQNRPGIFGQQDYVHRENLSSYKETLEGIEEIIHFVEQLPEPTGASVEQFCAAVLEKLTGLYESQVRLRAGIGMAIRCIKQCSEEK